ncbi:MAG: glycosyltransferase, partial [Bacilli bacterium]
MPSVRWEGPQFSLGSLAHVNREVCSRLLIAQDVDLSIIPFGADDIDPECIGSGRNIKSGYSRYLPQSDFHIRHQWPPNFSAPHDGQWILFQPWELGYIPKAWVEPILSQVDQVWVYSKNTLEMYVNSGIPEKKIFVFPLGVNSHIFCSSGPTLNLKTLKSFKFLFVGGTIWRKGIDILLTAYIKSFTKDDDVCLVIKDFGSNSFYKGQTSEETIRKLLLTPNAPEIIYISEDLTELQMAALYRSCNVLVHPYRGEGFGLPILEAMASGIPVIVPDKGPAIEFTNRECALYLPSSIIQGDLGTTLMVSNPKWIEVYSDGLAQVMIMARDHKVALSVMGNNAETLARNSYSWEHTVEAIVNRFHDSIDNYPIRLDRANWIGNVDATRQECASAEHCLDEAIEKNLEDPKIAPSNSIEKIPDKVIKDSSEQKPLELHIHGGEVGLIDSYGFNPLDFPAIWSIPRRLSNVTNWHGHIPFAFALISLLEPGSFVELGTHKGDSYFSFCQAIDRLGLSTECFAVDTWLGDDQAGHY